MINKPMKCDNKKCQCETRSIHIDKEHKKVCSKCYYKTK